MQNKLYSTQIGLHNLIHETSPQDAQILLQLLLVKNNEGVLNKNYQNFPAGIILLHKFISQFWKKTTGTWKIARKKKI